MSSNSPTDPSLEEFSFEEVERILNIKDAPKELVMKTIVLYMNRFFAVVKGTNPMYVEKTIKINYPINGKRTPFRKTQEEGGEENSVEDTEESEQSKTERVQIRTYDSNEDETGEEVAEDEENEEEMTHISIKTRTIKLGKGETANIEYIFRTEKGFKAAMANKLITIVTDKREVTRNKTRTVKEEVIISLYELWIKSPYRCEYDRMAFLEKADKKSFNMYHGLSIDEQDLDEYDPEDATPWLQHIKEIWCRGNEEVFVWVLKVLARKVQYPFKKSKVAVVLRGRQGSGKGIILEKIRQIFGSYFKTLRPNEFLGDFNGALVDALILFLDESVFSGDRKVASQLKTLITEPTILINQKHLPSFTIENNLDIFFATNYQQAVLVEEGDRRYFCLDCDGRWAGKATEESVKYFRNIAKIPYQCIYKFLCTVDVEDFEPTIYPVTSAIREQKIYGMDTVIGWVYHSIVEKKMWLKLASVSRQNLYHEYTDYVKALGGHYSRSFSLLQWQNRLKDCGIEKVGSNKTTLMIPRLSTIKSAMRTLLNDDEFPDLEDCDDDDEYKEQEEKEEKEEENEEKEEDNEDEDEDNKKEENEDKDEDEKEQDSPKKEKTIQKKKKSIRRKRRVDW